jgi:hypothetical protein
MSAALIVLAGLLPLQSPVSQEPGRGNEVELVGSRDVPASMTAEDARTALTLSLRFLVEDQNADGTWGQFVPTDVMELGFAAESYYDWNLAANFLVALALMECPETPERRAALDRGLRSACEKRMPIRGDDWDNDAMWTALYAVVTLTRASGDERFAGAEWQALIQARGRAYAGMLVRNQVAEGGWGYYDDPPFTQRPKWATSFATACVVPALANALHLGWIEDPQVVRRAVRYVSRCKLPNGAYEYDLNPIPRIPAGEHINAIQGSLGRIQVCNWALAEVGEKSITPERLREGLQQFFGEHRYLDAARLRPVPHEAYFANAGYFYFFGHYYAALAINLLPQAEREALHARLRPHLVKALRPDGSATDFLDAKYDVLASTAFLVLALQAGMEPNGS